MSSNIQVRDAQGSLLTMRTIEVDGVHSPYQTVGSVEKKFRDSFPGSSLDTNKWESSIGTGGTITVSGGQLVLGSGTSANAETSIISKETFIVPFRLSFHLSLSQRIANQSFIVEAVSVNPATGIPNGLHSCAMVYDGTSATSHKYRVQNSGLSPLDSGAVTFPTTASNGLYEIEPFADECWFHGGTLDATSGRANSYRRHQQIPDPNAVYKIRVRWLNGSTAPASNTNATMQFVAVQDYQELTAEITAGRGQTVAGQAIATHIASSTTLVASLVPNASNGVGTHHHLISAASVNATAVKASAGTINDIVLSNVSATVKFFKLYNKTTAPISTDTPIRVIALQPNSTITVGCGTFGIRLTTGIAYQITGGIANNDTTAIGANEVIVGISYT